MTQHRRNNLSCGFFPNQARQNNSYFIEAGLKIHNSKFQCWQNGKSVGSKNSEKRPNQHGNNYSFCYMNRPISYYVDIENAWKSEFRSKSRSFERKPQFWEKLYYFYLRHVKSWSWHRDGEVFWSLLPFGDISRVVINAIKCASA